MILTDTAYGSSAGDHPWSGRYHYGAFGLAQANRSGQPTAPDPNRPPAPTSTTIPTVAPSFQVPTQTSASAYGCAAAAIAVPWGTKCPTGYKAGTVSPQGRICCNPTFQPTAPTKPTTTTQTAPVPPGAVPAAPAPAPAAPSGITGKQLAIGGAVVGGVLLLVLLLR